MGQVGQVRTEISKRLLLINAEELIKQDENVSLEDYGYELIPAANTDEAAMTAETRKIDLIIMDNGVLRNMDETGIASAFPEDFDIPVIFLISCTDPEVLEKTERIPTFGASKKIAVPPYLTCQSEQR